ncbi:MAG: hypothetical protein LUH51_01735 [Firmicutes bacterium]|nr:hypothetical protein [Bacillota bacterium]
MVPSLSKNSPSRESGGRAFCAGKGGPAAAQHIHYTAWRGNCQGKIAEKIQNRSSAQEKNVKFVQNPILQNAKIYGILYTQRGSANPKTSFFRLPIPQTIQNFKANRFCNANSRNPMIAKGLEET